MQNRRYDDRDHGRRYGGGSDRDRRDDRRGNSRPERDGNRDFRDGNRDKRTGGDNSRNSRDRGVPKKEKDDKLGSNVQPHRINVHL